MNIKKISRNILVPIRHSLEAKVCNLRYLFFEITKSCNLNCIHCGSDCSKNISQEFLPEGAIIKVLEEVKTVYNPKKVTVAITGGEPYCYPDLFSLGRKITATGFPWGMVTNGYGWDKESIKKLEDSGIKTITVSIDGLEAEHNWLRGNIDSFEKAVNTIKLIKKSSFSSGLDVFTCVSKRNISQLDDIYELLKKLGVKRWRISPIDPIGNSAINNPELFLDSSRFRVMLEKTAYFKSLKIIDVNFTDSGYLGTEFENKARTLNFFCSAGINVGGIRSNGDIAACPNIDPGIKEGNIFQNSFIDVWQTKYHRFRKRNWMRTDICKDCSEWSLCNGNSFHLRDFKENKTRFCHKKFIER